MPDVPEVKYVRAGDASIAYSQWGEGEKTVVFTPPLVSNVELMWDLPEWERLFEWAGKHVRVLIMDKRGVGLSDRTSEPCALSDYVSDVLAVLDAENLKTVSIVGQSEGGVVGIALAALHPERVEKLCLIGTPALGVARDQIENRLREGERLPTEPQISELWRDLIRTWGTKDSIWLNWFAPSTAEDKRIQRWWNRFERQSCSPGALLTMVRSMSAFDVSPLLSKIEAPALVCHANGDLVAHVAEGRTLADLIPGAKFKEWENPNHLWGFAPTWRDHISDLIEFTTGKRPGAATTKSFAAILFSDIVDSTKRASLLGDEVWRATLEKHDNTCHACINARGGQVVKHTGDGVLATFPSPMDACIAAKQLTRDLDGLGVSIRAGVHIGQFEVHDDGDISGIAVNIASRVQSLAEPGEVIVSQTVKDMLMGSEISVAEKGTFELKGVEGSWRVFSLLFQ